MANKTFDSVRDTASQSESEILLCTLSTAYLRDRDKCEVPVELCSPVEALVSFFTGV